MIANILLCIGYFLWIHLAYGSTIYLPASEYNALYQLYNSTQGNHWDWRSNYQLAGYPWDFSSNSRYNNPCSSSLPWQGVTCSNNCSATNCHIKKLNLPFYNLNGTLPSSIGQFIKLTNLDLNSNQLIGSIPSEIGQLVELSIFYLYKNQLTGTIPSTIGQLIQLNGLDLDTNRLMGTIPSTIGQLVDLSIFYLYRNRLTGTIPSEISRLIKLTNLNFNTNQLTGTIPSEIHQLTELLALYLFHNQLTGTIPSSICQLVKLTNLNLNSNQFTGTIPIEINQLIVLTVLDLYNNQLTGTIPSNITQLLQLSDLNLNSNQLTGSIPSQISLLTQLAKFNLFNNQLTGSIPINIIELIRLIDIDVSNNQLTGSIPYNISQLVELTSLNLFGNHFTGSIPPTIGQLTQLFYLDLNSNQFTGTIPMEISQMDQLSNVYLYNNQLTGSIPSGICQLILLTDLDLNNNHFTGIIPRNLSQLTLLAYVDLSTNQLTSSIPSNMSKLRRLTTFDLENNLFTGTIPIEISQLANLKILFLDSNQFSGSISSNFASLTSLSIFSLSNNYFFSQFPSQILFLSQLAYIDISYNYFTSTISFTNNSFPNISLLMYLDFSSNLFSGSFPFLILYQQFPRLSYLNLANNFFISSIPDSLLPNQLQIVYLQNNSFTGSLPVNVLGQGSLKVMIASTNCFSGVLPEDLCQNQDLIQLNLDGLHSSSSCISKLAPWTGSSSYTMTSSVGGIIPTCLFNLPNLLSLHLSGNNFHGSLPSSIEYNSQISNLTVLSLANNRLTGEIPSYLLSNPNMINLDLSFNQFNTFGEDISSIQSFGRYNNLSTLITSQNQSYNGSIESNLRLQVNHLSGSIPSLWRNTPFIDLLEGNIFVCKVDRSDLPTQDPSYASYQCGSDNTNNSLYLLGGIFLVLTLGIYWLYGKKGYLDGFNLTKDLGINSLKHNLNLLIHKNTINKVISPSIPTNETNEMNSTNEEKPSQSFVNIQQMLHFYTQVNHWCQHMLFWLFCIISTMYILLTMYFGTYQHQYIWILSSSYLSGSIAALTMFVIFSLTLLWYLNQWNTIILNNQPIINFLTFSSLLSRNQPLLPVKIILFHVILFLVDIIVVLSVNISYIIAINHGYSYSTMTIISISISIFKLFWNDRFLLGKVRKILEQQWNITFSGKLILFLCLFNNVIIPYIAEAFVSSNCFLYIITNPPKIQSTYYNVECDLTRECGSYEYVCMFFIECNTFDQTIVSQNINSLLTLSNNSLYSSELSSLTPSLTPSNTPISSPLTSSTSSMSSAFVSSSYLPPFHYNYTCSSSLLTAFAYVFVYRYLISVFLLPMFVWGLKNLQQNYQQSFFQYNIQFLSLGKISNETQWLLFLTKLLPMLNKFEYNFVEINSTKSLQNKNINLQQKQEEDIETTLTQLEVESLHSQPIIIVNTTKECLITVDSIAMELLVNVEQGQASVIHLILDLTMLMSFGMLFPPLGFLILCSIIRYAIYQIHCLHYFVKYLLLSTNNDNETKNNNKNDNVVNKKEEDLSLLTIKTKIQDILSLLNEQYKEWNTLFVDGIWWTIVIAAWFWGISLYDTLGNSQGAVVSLWILLVMGCGPYICLVCLNYHQFMICNPDHNQDNASNNDNNTNNNKEIGMVIEITNPINKFTQHSIENK